MSQMGPDENARWNSAVGYLIGVFIGVSILIVGIIISEWRK